MNEQEAIKELSYDDTAYGGKCTKEVREVAIKALEKQIPKEPIDRCMFEECPACHNVEISHCNYCPDYGQALKRDRKE